VALCMPPVAVWGFADGDDVVDLMATDPLTTGCTSVSPLSVCFVVLAGALGVSARRITAAGA
jgi:hypothetical protein